MEGVECTKEVGGAERVRWCVTQTSERCLAEWSGGVVRPPRFRVVRRRWRTMGRWVRRPPLLPL
jgi:hypothetical protein